MNPSDIVFPTPAVELRLRRPAAEADASVDEQHAMLMAAQYQLSEDMAMLRQREDNLRAYETRLRLLQSRMEGDERATPAAVARLADRASAETNPALHASWDKLYRARELLEVEQKHLIEGRLLLREETQALVRREAAVTVREARVAEAEALRPTKEQAKAGGVRSLTRAPFDLAKAVFTKS